MSNKSVVGLSRPSSLSELLDETASRVSLAVEVLKATRDRPLEERSDGLQQFAQAAVPVAEAILSVARRKPLDHTEAKLLGKLADTFANASAEVAAFTLVDRNAMVRSLPQNTLWSEALPGDKAEATAAYLASRAATYNRPAAVIFREVPLYAMPGEDGTEAYQRFSLQMSKPDVDHSVRRITWDLRSQANMAKAQLELEALAKSPPRDIDSLIQWAKQGEESSYRSYIYKGLCELRHPEEIRAFANHYADEMHNLRPAIGEAANRTPDQSRETAIENMHYWVNAREGASPGTEPFWNAALDELKARAIGPRQRAKALESPES